MKVFFICAALFLIFAWVVISLEHNKDGKFPQVMSDNGGLLFNVPTN